MEADLGEGFVPGVVAFQEFLAARGIKLVMVLLPHPPVAQGKRESALVAMDGRIQQQPLIGGSRLIKAEQQLRHAHVRTLNLLPGAYHILCREPGRADLMPDHNHFGPATASVLGESLVESLTPKERSKSGRDVLFVGDCHALMLGEQLRQMTVLRNAHTLWKNAGSNLMAREISSLSEEQLRDVHQVFWCMTDAYLEYTNPAVSLIPPLASSRNSAPGATGPPLTVEATVVKQTVVPPGLGDAAPYPNALVLHKFHTSDQGAFLLIVYIMKNKNVDALVSTWRPEEKLLVTLEPWEAAVEKNPALRHERVLDDVLDFELPRYYITSWLRPDPHWR